MKKMKISKEEYLKLKGSTERKLRSYPYYLISVENSASKEDDKVRIINMINHIYNKELDVVAKRIIETAYFTDNITRNEVIKELHIDDNCYYRTRKKALEKFIIGLSYLDWKGYDKKVKIIW